MCGALQRALPRQPPPVVGGCEKRDDANDAEGRGKLAVWRLRCIGGVASGVFAPVWRAVEEAATL